MKLTTNKLSIGYGTKVVQSDLCLEALSGQMIAMLGKNGCGKSTLLRTLSGLQPPINGDITYQHQNKQYHIKELTSAERSELLALVLTERVSVEQTKVEDIVAMGRFPYIGFLGKLRSHDKDIIYKSLCDVGMEQKINDYFNSLSDGEKQRVLIAKALAQMTPMVMLDEPTAHLDLPNRIKILLLLRRLAEEQNKCIIISTHELDLAMQTANYVWLMNYENGIIAGTPDDLINTNAFAEAFKDNTFTFVTTDNKLQIKLY